MKTDKQTLNDLGNLLKEAKIEAFDCGLCTVNVSGMSWSEATRLYRLLRRVKRRKVA